MLERRALLRHKSPLPLAKTITTCWTGCLREKISCSHNKRVVRNGGAPGVDGVTVAELQAYLNTHWAQVKAELLAGTYKPAPVKQVEIPKPGGGVRLLGIPTEIGRASCRERRWNTRREEYA